MVAHGRVQGVWFRDSTKKEATRLGIQGYVRNLSNGDVEIVALGTPAAIDALSRWARKGPPQAEVMRLDIEESPIDSTHSGFEVRY